MRLEFTKMHGLGNDFVVLNALEQEINLSAEQYRALADRRFGIGCDQILLLEPSSDENMDIRYRIFNADGNEVEHCGNGIRCVGLYLTEKGYVSKDVIHAETMNRNASIYMNGTDQIRVDMGVPRFEPGDIPMDVSRRQNAYELALPSGKVTVLVASMGNPHAVLLVDDVETAPVESVGREMQASPLFPDSVNVGFMQILDPGHVRLRVYERGVGETLACGTGACAAMVVGNMANKLEKQVDIGLKGGHLCVDWDGEGEPVWMTGPATIVYEGQIDL